MTDPAVETILITGALGQVGKRCAEILLDRGRTVIATDLRTEKSQAVANELASSSGTGAPTARVRESATLWPPPLPKISCREPSGSSSQDMFSITPTTR